MTLPGCTPPPREAGTSAPSSHVGHDHEDAPAGPAAEALAADWCFEHDVPESGCTQCNPALIARFKAEGDWCAGHGLPESQCLQCNPELAAQFAALRPQRPEQNGPADEDELRVEPAPRGFRPVNDPLCAVEDNIIRLRDPSIAAKAGIGVERAGVRRITSVIECPAEVRYDATRLARVTARAEGVVLEVAVDLGDNVSPGALLAATASPTMGEAKAAYIDALQRRQLAQADLDRHNRIHDGIERMLGACGADVDSDQLRRRFAEVRIGEYKSRLLNAHAQLELTRRRFAREQELVERGVSSQDALQTARRDLDQAEADFAATHESIAIEMEQEHLAYNRALAVADVTLDAARRRLHILGVDDAAIHTLDAGADEALSRYEIRSPLAGRVVERNAVVGESVTTADTLFSIADTSRLWLLLSLEERELPAIEPGRSVQFTVDGLPGRVFGGRIDWISSEVEEPSRSVRARVPLDNSDGLLRANMFGVARVVVRDGEDVLTVPEAAVQSDGCCNIVFVKESETVFRPRKIGVGPKVSGVIEVLDGLAAGEPVATAGSFLLKTEILKGSIGAGCCEVDPGR